MQVFPKNNSGRNLIFELIQGIMVIKLQYKFQIDRNRNKEARASGWNCFGCDGRTDGRSKQLLDLLLLRNAGKKRKSSSQGGIRTRYL